MTVPSVHSPAEAKFDALRQTGQCVTAEHDLSHAGHPVVEVLVEAQASTTSRAIAPPKHESMPDG